MNVYLFVAYAVFWALTFALVLSIWSRQRRVEREIMALEQRLAAEEREPRPESRPSAAPSTRYP